jgi:hypothetical protein
MLQRFEGFTSVEEEQTKVPWVHSLPRKNVEKAWVDVRLVVFVTTPPPPPDVVLSPHWKDCTSDMRGRTADMGLI